MKICAVIPAYNEETTVGNIVQNTKKYIDAVFVVNNRSTDNTARIARENGAIVIDYFAKRGYGAAQYAGQQYAIKQGYEYILQLDSDGQHDPADIPKLIETMESGNWDIVLGSRFLATGYKAFSFTRRIGIIFFSKIISFLGHTKVTDITSGFKIYKVSSLKKLSKPSDLHPAIEQITEIAKKRMKIKEIPIVMLPRLKGNSHLSTTRLLLYPFRATWNILKVLLFK